MCLRKLNQSPNNGYSTVDRLVHTVGRFARLCAPVELSLCYTTADVELEIGYKSSTIKYKMYEE